MGGKGAAESQKAQLNTLGTIAFLTELHCHLPKEMTLMLKTTEKKTFQNLV